MGGVIAGHKLWVVFPPGALGGVGDASQGDEQEEGEGEGNGAGDLKGDLELQHTDSAGRWICAMQERMQARRGGMGMRVLVWHAAEGR